MANNCSYYLKAVARDKLTLERLYKIMKYEDADNCLYRVREAHAIDAGECVEEGMCLNWLDADSCEPVKVEDAIFEEDGGCVEDDFPGYFCLFLTGDVAWSAESWFNGEDKPDERAENGTAHLTSLNVIAKKLGLGIELWGHEEFNTFQQHFIMNAAGEMAVAETKDWNGYSEAEIEDMKLEFEDMPEEVKEDCPLNDTDFDPDAIGFGDGYCRFSSAKRIYEAVSAIGNAEGNDADGAKGKVKLQYKIKTDKRIGKYAVITGARDVQGNLMIPAEVEGCPVKRIGEEAFCDCEGLTNVTIPDGVTGIGSSAFSECSGLMSVTIPASVTSIENHVFFRCKSLTSVTMPNSVTSIGNYAFYNCSCLANVTIPNGVTSIGDYAFSDCIGLTSVAISASVTSIGKRVFDGCKNLKLIQVEAGNSSYKSVSGLLLTKDGTKIVAMPENIGSATIPDGVVSIGNGEFEKCRGLTNLTIPSSVTDIGDYAFYDCENLRTIKVEEGNPHYKSVDDLLLIKDGATLVFASRSSRNVTIPDSVTSIGDYAFRGCRGMTSVTIPNSVTSIGYEAFSGCSGLTSVTIPDGVTSIEENTFSGCGGLTSITIPDGVTSIGSNAFEDCNSLYDAKSIPGVKLVDGWVVGHEESLSGELDLRGVRGIGDDAFSGCSKLTGVVIPDGVMSIGMRAFEKCSKIASITIPNGVTSIGIEAFAYCSGLKNVTIPDSVTSIEWSAFKGCSGLKNVTIPDSVTSIGHDSFAGCSGLTSVTIPDSVTSIEIYVFLGCSGLKNVSLPKHLKDKLPRNVFYNCPKNLKITYRESTTTKTAPSKSSGVAKNAPTKSEKKPAASKARTGAAKKATAKSGKKATSPKAKGGKAKPEPAKKPTVKKAVKKTAKKK